MSIHKFGYSKQPDSVGMSGDEIELLRSIEEECLKRSVDFDSFLNKVIILKKR